MFDADKFISCIRAMPTLWDVRLQSYNDKIKRDRAWLELGQNIYPEWPTIDGDKAECKVKEMKSKWRNIRDNYLKYINQCSSGGAPTPRKKRKYVYADKLAFLQHTVGQRRVVVARQGGDIITSGNEVSLQNDDNDEYTNPEGEDGFGEGAFAEGEYVEYDDEDISEKIILANTTEPSAPMCLLDLPETSFTQTPSTKYSHQQGNDMTQFQVNVMKKLDALKHPEVEDPDKYFLMSILPDYKKLNEEEKLDFRINCLHFFRDVKNKQSQNRPSKRKH